MRARCPMKGDTKPTDLPTPTKFPDRISFDYAILNEDDGGVIQMGGTPKVSLVIQDAFTKWLDSFPSPSKAAERVIIQIHRFLGPGIKANHAYSDNAKE